MKGRPFVMLLSLIGLLAFGLNACTQKVDSKPHFIFKAAPDGTAVAKVNGEVITKDDLYKGIESEIYEAEKKVHEIKMNRLRAILLERYMQADKRKAGLSNDEYLEKYIAKDSKVSKKDIEAFIKERKFPKEHVNDQMKDRIKKFLGLEQKKKAVDQWLTAQTKKSPVEVYMAEPTRPIYEINVDEHSPAWGKSDAKVTLVEFSDFQCPFCAKGSEIINQVKKKYKNKVKIVFKNFPLPFHHHAKKAAVASLCANEQGPKSFWKLHDEMFNNQQKLGGEGLKELAKSAGLKMEKFSSCLDANKYLARVEADIEEGKDIGVKSTPTFFINGKIINGAHPIEVFSELIDEELNR